MSRTDVLRVKKAQFILGMLILTEMAIDIVVSPWTEEEERLMEEDCIEDLQNPRIIAELEREVDAANKLV